MVYNTKHNSKVLYFATLLFSLSLNLSAKELPDLLNMTLEEILQVTISVASPSTERIIETPAVVSRYNVDDMSGMGLRTLKDILSFIPGFVLQDSRTGGTSVMIRGLVEAFNQKVLFLLNGVPYWMPSHSEIPLLGIPIEAISHIEVIRGPGAVIYGTNASAGVINVVTKQTENSVVAVSVGSNNRANGSSYLQHQISDDSFFSIALEAQSDKGYQGEFKDVSQPGFFPAGISNDGSATKSEQMKSVLAKYHNGSFNFFGQAFKTLVDEQKEDSSLVIGTDLQHTGYLLHADNTWSVRSTEFKLFSDFNRFSLEFESDNLLAVGVNGGFRFDDGGDDNYRWRSGGTMLHRASESLSFFGGFEFERRKIEDYFVYSVATDENINKLINSQHTIERSLYGQADYTLGKWRFLFGGRYTNNSQSGEKVTPRLSSVYNIDQSQSLKLLYSVGFNAPNFTQTFINAPGLLAGNPALKAETVRTLDLAYSYEADNNLFVANAYYLEAEDFIQRSFQDGLISFFNSNKFKRCGVELDFQRATFNYLFFANLSYIHQGDTVETDDNIARFAPRVTSSFGLSHKVTQQQTTGLSLRAIGQHNKAPTTYQLNLDYGYQHGPMELFFSIRNIFDEHLIATDIVDLTDDQLVPNGDGINILTGLKYYF
mgnify:CR=1 FL=1